MQQRKSRRVGTEIENNSEIVSNNNIVSLNVKYQCKKKKCIN